MNANSPRPKYVFTLINLNDGQPNPWALMDGDDIKKIKRKYWWPAAHFATKAEAIACLKYCIVAAEMDDDDNSPS